MSQDTSYYVISLSEGNQLEETRTSDYSPRFRDTLNRTTQVVDVKYTGSLFTLRVFQVYLVLES